MAGALAENYQESDMQRRCYAAVHPPRAHPPMGSSRCSKHLADTLEIIRMVDSTDFVNRLEKSEAWIARRRARGQPVTARHLVAGVRDISSAHEATGILRILGVNC